MLSSALDDFVHVPAEDDDGEAELLGGASGDESEEDAGDVVEGHTAVEHLPGRGAHFSCQVSRHFLRVRFEGSIPGDSLSVQLVVMQSLRTLYGQAGAAIAVDVLHYAPKLREIILVVPSQASTRVRNAISVITEWELAPLRARVVQSSPHLLSILKLGEE